MIVSIYVNPTQVIPQKPACCLRFKILWWHLTHQDWSLQFAQHEDFGVYPRDEVSDTQVAIFLRLLL